MHSTRDGDGDQAEGYYDNAIDSIQVRERDARGESISVVTVQDVNRG
jgi:hypothetical protein